jgi:glucose-6-phosphate 1-dehydrogenase
MECPGKNEPELIRNSKVDVLKDIRTYSTAEVYKNIVKGQYTTGKINGTVQTGYLQENNVPKIRLLKHM